MNVAIFSPNKNPYSETFIQAHKKYLKEKVFYYYGSKNSMQLEGSKRLVSRTRHLYLRITGKLNKHSTSYTNEQSVLASLKKNNIHVILVEYGTHAYKVLNILKTSKLPIVVHFHGYDASVKSVIKENNNYKDVFALASKVVAVSIVMKNKLISLGCSKDKIIHTPCAPHFDFEKVQPNYSKKQFIAIGRFTDKKAPYYTIMAFKNVIFKHPDATLLLAGEGMLLNMCKNLVRQYDLENQVQFLGVITPEEYREVLIDSLAFVQHSITALNGDMEGTPVALLEASVAGLPVIATKHAGIPDVIIDGETGLLCNEHDVKTMTNNMLQVLDDYEYAKKMGASGKQNILKNFSMQKHIKTLQNLLEDVSKLS